MRTQDKALIWALWLAVVVALGLVLWQENQPPEPEYPYTCRVVMPEDLDR